MARKKFTAPFFLVVTDQDKGRFNVIGPMSDDTDWIEKVIFAQGQGRVVNCHSTRGEKAKAQIIEDLTANLSLEYSEERLL